MNKRAGLTLSSIVIYVVLFFIFSVFAVSMSTNMNYKSMSEKGNVYIHEQFEKLQYNMITSSKKSNSLNEIYGKIVFSNQDEYSYDASKKVVYKNEGILVDSVEEFEVIDFNEVSNIPVKFLNNKDENIDSICMKITLKKYGKQITKDLVIAIGDE